MELELPAELGELPEGTEVSWCRYMVRKDGAEPVSEEISIRMSRLLMK